MLTPKKDLQMVLRPHLLGLPNSQLLSLINKLLAMLMLIMITYSTIAAWPLADHGFDVNGVTHRIETVVAGGVADKAGLRVGDYLKQYGGYPPEVVLRSLNVVQFVGASDQPVPVVVE